MKINRIWAIFILMLGLVLMAYGGGRLLLAQQSYEEANSAYNDISTLVRTAQDIGAGAGVGVSGNMGLGAQTQWDDSFGLQDENTQGAKAKPVIDFEKLRSVSKDAAAWLYNPGTVIDYPVMQAEDYSYYLDRLPDGTRNANGSLFIDYNSAADFSGRLTVIYGHHMKSGRMFGSLVGYKSQSYFEKHPYMYLYTEAGDYRIDLVYGSIIDAGQWRDRAFMYEENIDALLTYAAHNTSFKSQVQYGDEDRIVVLSTCSYEFDDARYVVVGVLKPLI